LLKGVEGNYFEDCNEARSFASHNGYMSGAARYALNSANADRLWEAAQRFLA